MTANVKNANTNKEPTQKHELKRGTEDERLKTKRLCESNYKKQSIGQQGMELHFQLHGAILQRKPAGRSISSQRKDTVHYNRDFGVTD